MKGFANEGTSTHTHMTKAAYLRQRGVNIKNKLMIMKGSFLQSTSTQPHMAKAAYLRQRG